MRSTFWWTLFLIASWEAYKAFCAEVLNQPITIDRQLVLIGLFVLVQVWIVIKLHERDHHD